MKSNRAVDPLPLFHSLRENFRSLRCVRGIKVAGWAQGFRRSKAYMANALAIVVSWALGRILLSLGLFRHMYLHHSELSLIDRPGAGCDRLGALSQHRAVR